jgi:hypothetical protein
MYKNFQDEIRLFLLQSLTPWKAYIYSKPALFVDLLHGILTKHSQQNKTKEISKQKTKTSHTCITQLSWWGEALRLSYVIVRYV